VERIVHRRDFDAAAAHLPACEENRPQPTYAALSRVTR
jgi:hypothetical protein